MNLSGYEKKILGCDRDIARAFARRMKLTEQMAEEKYAHGLGILKKRPGESIDRACEVCADACTLDYLEQLFHIIFKFEYAYSHDTQKRLKAKRRG